jgi:hypothetical protein
MCLLLDVCAMRHELCVHTSQSYLRNRCMDMRCKMRSGSVGTLSSGPGCAVAQAARHWLPTVAARVRARVRSCGICGGQSGAAVGFLRVLRFQSAKHSTDCSTLIIFYHHHHLGLVQ